MKGGGDAPIAQLVERYTCNVKVSCSIHGGSLANVGELAQMVERTLSMREAGGSMPPFSIYNLNPCLLFLVLFKLLLVFFDVFILSQFLTDTHWTGFLIFTPN